MPLESSRKILHDPAYAAFSAYASHAVLPNIPPQSTNAYDTISGEASSHNSPESFKCF